jgi:hypothetical protein
MPSDINRRRLKRHVIQGNVEVTNKMTAESAGRLVNIHSEGVLIVNSQPLKLESLYQLQLTFPKSVDGIDSVDIAVDCVWVAPLEEKADTYWSGCRIIDISEDDLKIIDEMIRRFSIN